MRRLLWPLLLTLCCLGLAQAESARLKPGDEIKVVVVGLKEYTSEYTVLDDGSINGMGFGRVEVAGKTLSQVDDEITALLAKRLRKPAVDIVLLKQRKDVIYVVGDAQTEGPVEFTPGMDLRQLLGAVRLAQPPNRYDVTLNRTGETPVRVDLHSLLTSDSTPNPRLKANDVVGVLPKASMRVWVTGQVIRPGETSVESGADPYQAIAQAGGASIVTPVNGTSALTLNELRVLVRRGGEVVADLPGQEVSGQPPFKLEAGDVVVVQPPSQVRVIIAGEVVQPGEVVLREGSTVAAAIALARGASQEGSLKSVTVIRGHEAFQVDATYEGLKGQAFTVQAGDAIFVPKNERAVYILGQVHVPGKYLIPDNQEMDSAELLAMAKGVTPDGTLRRVVLIRPDEKGRYTARQFNLDEFLKDGKVGSNPKLQPGDVVLFGRPQGFNLASMTASVGQLTSTALLLDTLLNRR